MDGVSFTLDTRERTPPCLAILERVDRRNQLDFLPCGAERESE